MDSFREFLKKNAWAGWVLAMVFLVASVILYRKLSGANDPYSVERLSETVTLKDSQTGEEWTMPRGVMETQLRERGLSLDAKEGLPNPKTGTLTGFPKNSEWEETVTRLNRETQELVKSRQLRPPQQSSTPATLPGGN
ncbi:MAG: hypothetical protein KF745_00085 [Phycisphaeraceae bacterium]|nr:hypothetical protein [Phycisphaeraceae bacterium]